MPSKPWRDGAPSPFARDTGTVEIAFEDQGPGIPDDVLPHVFDPFFTTKPPGQGTGLGLALAQGIVADHGGRIEVTSRVGAGAAFRVMLPLADGGPDLVEDSARGM